MKRTVNWQLKIYFFWIIKGLGLMALAQSSFEEQKPAFMGHFRPTANQIIEKKCSTEPLPLECSTAGKRLDDCRKKEVPQPPFSVIETGFDPATEKEASENRNYVAGRTTNPSRTANYILPKRSIVQVLAPLTAEQFANPETLVPIRVLSTPSENKALLKSNSAQVQNISTYQLPDKSSKVKASVASSAYNIEPDGYVKSTDLSHAGSKQDSIFIVKRNTPLFRELAERFPKTQFALQLIKENGLYTVNECCDHERPRTCRQFPIFRVLNMATGESLKKISDPTTEATIPSACEGCLLNEVVPMSLDFMKPLQGIMSALREDQVFQNLASIEKLNFVDSRGFVQIPTVSIPGDSTGRKGPFGTYHYRSESGESDIYMRPEAACGLMQIMKTWNEKHCQGQPGCQIEFGDASHALHKGNNGQWNHHHDHAGGDCIDIRPMNPANSPLGGSLFSDSGFQRENFKTLLELFAKAGAEGCILGDSQMTRQLIRTLSCSPGKMTPKVINGQEKLVSDHDNHLHICLPKYLKDKSLNSKLKSACTKGLD